MKIFNTLQDLMACVGQDVAVSDWVTVTQEQINLFAQATGDHQWIHTDADKAHSGPLNKVRFTAPVPVNSRLRSHMHLLACEAIDNNGMQMTWKVSVEREGSDKPVCVAESLVRRYP
jgi:acyl dehydratase